MIIHLNDAEINKCSKFAHDVVNTNIDKYKERNQNNVTKIVEDIYVGKLAEYATYKMLISKGREVSEPDLAVYSAKKKSFSPDLSDGRLNFHVKCMKKSMAERFGLSWSFQIEDKLVKRPSNEDALILCEVDNNVVDIKAVIRANRVVDLYTKPALKKLWNIKKVLMWEDVFPLLKPVT